MCCMNTNKNTNTKTETKAMIIRNNELVAHCKTSLKNGENIEYAYELCPERINLNREHNLVNALVGKISRNKKFDLWHDDYGTEINSKQFHVKAIVVGFPSVRGFYGMSEDEY